MDTPDKDHALKAGRDRLKAFQKRKSRMRTPSSKKSSIPKTPKQTSKLKQGLAKLEAQTPHTVLVPGKTEERDIVFPPQEASQFTSSPFATPNLSMAAMSRIYDNTFSPAIEKEKTVTTAAQEATIARISQLTDEVNASPSESKYQDLADAQGTRIEQLNLMLKQFRVRFETLKQAELENARADLSMVEQHQAADAEEIGLLQDKIVLMEQKQATLMAEQEEQSREVNVLAKEKYDLLNTKSTLEKRIAEMEVERQDVVRDWTDKVTELVTRSTQMSQEAKQKEAEGEQLKEELRAMSSSFNKKSELLDIAAAAAANALVASGKIDADSTADRDLIELIGQLKEAAESEHADLETRTKERDQLVGQVAEAVKEKGDAQAKLYSVTHEVGALGDENEALLEKVKTLTAAQQQVDLLTSARTDDEGVIASLNEKISSLEADVASGKHALDEARMALNEMDGEGKASLLKAQNELAKEKQVVAKAKSDLAALTAKNAKLAESFGSANKNLQVRLLQLEESFGKDRARLEAEANGLRREMEKRVKKAARHTQAAERVQGELAQAKEQHALMIKAMEERNVILDQQHSKQLQERDAAHDKLVRALQESNASAEARHKEELSAVLSDVEKYRKESIARAKELEIANKAVLALEGETSAQHDTRVQMGSTLSQREAEITDLREQAAQGRQLVDDLQKRLAESEKSRVASEDIVVVQNKQRAEMQAEFDTQTGEYTRQLETMAQGLAELQHSLQAATDDLKSKEAEIQDMKDQKTAYQSQMAALKKSVDVHVASIEKDAESKVLLEQTALAHQEDLERKQRLIESLEGSVKARKAEFDQLRLRFEEEQKDLLSKLEQKSVLMASLEKSVQARQDEFDQLRMKAAKEKAELEGRIKEQDVLMSSQQSSLRARVDEYRALRSQTEKEIEGLSKDLEEKKSLIVSLEGSVKARTQEFEDLRVQCEHETQRHQALKEKVRLEAETLAEKENLLEKSGSRLALVGRENLQIKEELEAMAEKLTEAETRQTEFDSEREVLQGEISELTALAEAEKEGFAARIAYLESREKELHSKMERVEQEAANKIETLEAEAVAARQEATITEHSMRASAQELEMARRRLEIAERDGDHFDRQIAHKEEAVEEKEAEIEVLEGELEEARDRILVLEEQIKQASVERKDQLQVLQQAKDEIVPLSSRLDGQQQRGAELAEQAQEAEKVIGKLKKQLSASHNRCSLFEERALAMQSAVFDALEALTGLPAGAAEGGAAEVSDEESAAQLIRQAEMDAVEAAAALREATSKAIARVVKAEESLGSRDDERIAYLERLAESLKKERANAVELAEGAVRRAEQMKKEKVGREAELRAQIEQLKAFVDQKGKSLPPTPRSALESIGAFGADDVSEETAFRRVAAALGPGMHVANLAACEARIKQLVSLAAVVQDGLGEEAALPADMARLEDRVKQRLGHARRKHEEEHTRRAQHITELGLVFRALGGRDEFPEDLAGAIDKVKVEVESMLARITVELDEQYTAVEGLEAQLQQATQQQEAGAEAPPAADETSAVNKALAAVLFDEETARSPLARSGRLEAGFGVTETAASKDDEARELAEPDPDQDSRLHGELGRLFTLMQEVRDQVTLAGADHASRDTQLAAALSQAELLLRTSEEKARALEAQLKQCEAEKEAKDAQLGEALSAQNDAGERAALLEDQLAQLKDTWVSPQAMTVEMEEVQAALETATKELEAVKGEVALLHQQQQQQDQSGSSPKERKGEGSDLEKVVVLSPQQTKVEGMPETEVEDLKDLNNALRDELDAVSHERDNVYQRLQMATKEAAELKQGAAEASQLRTDRASLTGEVEVLKSERRRLRSELEALRSATARATADGATAMTPARGAGGSGVFSNAAEADRQEIKRLIHDNALAKSRSRHLEEELRKAVSGRAKAVEESQLYAGRATLTSRRGAEMEAAMQDSKDHVQRLTDEHALIHAALADANAQAAAIRSIQPPKSLTVDEALQHLRSNLEALGATIEIKDGETRSLALEIGEYRTRMGEQAQLIISLREELEVVRAAREDVFGTMQMLKRDYESMLGKFNEAQKDAAVLHAGHSEYMKEKKSFGVAQRELQAELITTKEAYADVSGRLTAQEAETNRLRNERADAIRLLAQEQERIEKTEVLLNELFKEKQERNSALDGLEDKAQALALHVEKQRKQLRANGEEQQALLDEMQRAVADKDVAEGKVAENEAEVKRLAGEVVGLRTENKRLQTLSDEVRGTDQRNKAESGRRIKVLREDYQRQQQDAEAERRKVAGWLVDVYTQLGRLVQLPGLRSTNIGDLLAAASEGVAAVSNRVTTMDPRLGVLAERVGVLERRHAGMVEQKRYLQQELAQVESTERETLTLIQAMGGGPRIPKGALMGYHGRMSKFRLYALIVLGIVHMRGLAARRQRLRDAHLSSQQGAGGPSREDADRLFDMAAREDSVRRSLLDAQSRNAQLQKRLVQLQTQTETEARLRRELEDLKRSVVAAAVTSVQSPARAPPPRYPASPAAGLRASGGTPPAVSSAEAAQRLQASMERARLRHVSPVAAPVPAFAASNPASDLSFELEHSRRIVSDTEAAFLREEMESLRDELAAKAQEDDALRLSGSGAAGRRLSPASLNAPPPERTSPYIAPGERVSPITKDFVASRL